MDLKDLNEEQLKKELLKAEIISKKHSVSYFGKISNLVALFSSIGALIAAFVALNVANSDHAKKIIDAYQSKIELLENTEKLNKIKTELSGKEKQLSEINSKLSMSKRTQADITRKINSIQNAIDTNTDKQISGINVEISRDKKSYFLTIDTFPSNQEVEVYAECHESFVFPEFIPNPLKCNYLSSQEFENIIKSPYKYGPINLTGNMRSDVWVIVKFDTHKEVRYINLSGY